MTTFPYLLHPPRIQTDVCDDWSFNLAGSFLLWLSEPEHIGKLV